MGCMETGHRWDKWEPIGPCLNCGLDYGHFVGAPYPGCDCHECELLRAEYRDYEFNRPEDW